MRNEDWPDGLTIQIEGASDFLEALEMAIQYYQQKYGRQPNEVYADPNLDGFLEIPGIHPLPKPEPGVFVLTHQ